MACPCYLAMTSAQMLHADCLPTYAAYMSCHFSSSGPGLGNLPDDLPGGAIVILDDSIPLGDQQPEYILRQLDALLSCHPDSKLLLDFQRPVTQSASHLVSQIAAGFPGRVAVSSLYGKALSCPVLLPPIPPDCRPEDYLAPWKGREIWLEAAPEALELVVAKNGCRRFSFPLPTPLPAGLHYDQTLFCHYHAEVFPSQVRFTLYRTPEDLLQLLKKADSLGVTQAVGLYQELSSCLCKNLPA